MKKLKLLIALLLTVSLLAACGGTPAGEPESTAVPTDATERMLTFQGKSYIPESEVLTVTSLSEADIAALAQFEQLAVLDATGCSDQAMLAKAKQQFPELEIRCDVTLDGKSFPWDTAEISLNSTTPAELEAVLPLLPQLTSLTITAPGEANAEALLSLMETYPQLSVNFDFTINGVTLNSLAETADFSEQEIEDLDALEAILSKMPNLTTVEMHNCGIDDETMDALNRRHEDIRFIWTVIVDGYPLRTDATWFMPVKMSIYPDDEEMAKLKYCTDMEAVDIGHIGIITNLDWAAYMPKLRFLIFVETSITDLTPLTNLPNLEYLEMFINPIEDLSPLATLKNLKHLNLCYVRCEGDVDVICQMPWLERLWWKVYMDPVSPEDQEKIRAALPNTLINFISTEATSDGWRTHDIYFEMRDFFGMSYMQ